MTVQLLQAQQMSPRHRVIESPKPAFETQGSMASKILVPTGLVGHL